MWLPGCCPAGVALKGVVWEDVAQQGQYGCPAPEAVCGERGGLLTGCLTPPPHPDKTNVFKDYKTLLRVLVLEPLWVLRELLEGLPWWSRG